VETEKGGRLRGGDKKGIEALCCPRRLRERYTSWLFRPQNQDTGEAVSKPLEHMEVFWKVQVGGGNFSGVLKVACQKGT
jgi:hypothetical protein